MTSAIAITITITKVGDRFSCDGDWYGCVGMKGADQMQ